MRIRLFDGIEVATDDAVGTTIGAPKARWLLAYLALAPGSSRSVASIIDALWHESPPRSAPNLVQGYVSDLRKVLGRETILTTENGYQLTIDGDHVDVGRFRLLAQTARATASSDPAAADDLLRRALAIGSGVPFGESPPDGPLSSMAAALREEQADVAELRAAILLDLGNHLDAIALLERLCRLHPYRESVWALLALALYRGDRQVEALRRLAEASQMLRSDLGLTPGPRLVELERQILEHSPALAPVEHSNAKVNPMTTVGRDPELARLDNRLRNASDGAHHTVFVGGEPGIGKTTLILEFSRTIAAEHTIVLTGRCDEHVAVPYRPFIESITGHLRSIGDDETYALLNERSGVVVQVIPSLKAIFPQSEVEVVGRPVPELPLMERFDTLCWILQRIQGKRGLVVVLEDLHWADSATLRLIHYLASGNRLPRSLTLGTYRTTEGSELLRDILADLRTVPEVERLLLRGLDESDLLRWISDAGLEIDDRTAAWIHRETDGNPFFAGELIDHVIRTGHSHGVPDGVVEVVSRRLRRLSPEAQLVLQYAAVLGETGPVSLLRRFAGIVTNVPDALAEIVRAGILSEEHVDEPRYRFAHAIIRNAATTQMTSLHLQDLNLAAAQAWHAEAESDDAAVAIASHYLAAGAAAPRESAAAAYIRAGAASDRTGAKVEAVQWYTRALDRLPAEDPQRTNLRLQKFVAAQVAWHWLHGDHRRPISN